MNAVEIEEAVSRLVVQPFDPINFPYAFLEAFGNKATTIQRLRSGSSNKSDVDGGVLQHNNIHIAIAPLGETSTTLTKLRESPATTRQKAKFILATDGKEFQAEDLTSDIPPIVCEYKDFPDHFGFFLPLAGISTVKQIRESSFDIKATGRLNRLYVELLKDNPEWGTAERRHDMNHFMTRLIFCFFAEDTEIFSEIGLFTNTIQQMSASDSSNTHEVIGEIFRAMNTTWSARGRAKLPRWADFFPYVNGGLFSGSTDTPQFSKIARAYLLNIGKLDWKKINPDIFGSMIQAVAEDEERGALGMHYTSVSNIRRVLNPLFLDDLRSQLEKAGNNQRMLLNLRKRISKIRIFDPACGSGNFLVIAYKDMREIEFEINKRRNETHLKSEISLTNFRGIELRDFPAEVARLALIIAEYQCDVLYRGQKEALAEFLPLDAENWIVTGNALRVNWEEVCPGTKSSVVLNEEDLFQTPLSQPRFDLDSEEMETYLCGNPPYLGSKKQSDEQKSDLKTIFESRIKNWKSLDYVAGWFMKAADYGTAVKATAAFVATNSICQGQSVPILWPAIFNLGYNIIFAHTSFKWANLASHNAGVTVVIVGISKNTNQRRHLYSIDDNEVSILKETSNINAYLVGSSNIEINPISLPLDDRAVMQFGNHTYYGADLLMSSTEAADIVRKYPEAHKYIRLFLGSKEVTSGVPRKCLWISDAEATEAEKIQPIQDRLLRIQQARAKMKNDKSAQKLAMTPYKFREQYMGERQTIVMPAISSENRPYLPVTVVNEEHIIGHKCFALYDASLWNMAIIASRLHWVWIGTVCVRMRTDFSYSNTLGWNTFPIPKLTEQNKADLTRCAENILLAREAHFPASIANLYDPDEMPEDLRRAHQHNDEILERIYIGRRFKNDSERLEKLFELYTRMTPALEAVEKPKRKAKKKEAKA